MFKDRLHMIAIVTAIILTIGGLYFSFSQPTPTQLTTPYQHVICHGASGDILVEATGDILFGPEPGRLLITGKDGVEVIVNLPQGASCDVDESIDNTA